VDGEFKSFEGDPPYIVTTQPAATRKAYDCEQTAYEFGRQEKAQEILEALTREKHGEKQ
jgi:hypothetical protein